MDTIEVTGKPGSPRTEAEAELLARWQARMALPIVLSAVLPLFFLPSTDNLLAPTIAILSWLVFLADLIVEHRHRLRYLHTWQGRMDLAIVILTAPWFLLPASGNSKFLLVVRLARLLRVIVATRSARRLFERIGRVALVAVAVVFIGAFFGYRAEHTTNPEFKTYGDSVWWATVTVTTVGYGDVVPITAAGRIVGAGIMITGLGVVGVLAGSLAQFFRLDPAPSDAPSGAPPPAGAAPPPGDVDQLTAEVAALRAHVSLLTERLGRLLPEEPG